MLIIIGQLAAYKLSKPPFFPGAFCFQLVLTYNFATANTETTYHKLQTLTSTLQLVSSFQNCELKQELRTQATAL